MNRTYGYMHWTLEDVPRCFYVGKGVKSRATQTSKRNHKWHAIVKRFGLRVEVYIGPVTNEEACAWEIKQIARWGTFSTDHSHNSLNIGCNFTSGGEGAPGVIRSEDFKQAHRKPWSQARRTAFEIKQRGKKRRSPSLEDRLKMSIRQTGVRPSQETRDKRSRTQTCKKRGSYKKSQ